MSSPPYTVNVNRPTEKEIRALDAAIRLRVLQALHSLANEPRPAGCRKLIGSENRWRVRVGDYRIIYAVNDAGRMVEIIAVRHRSKAYE
jgi:mRNA interferase RelE/StbE